MCSAVCPATNEAAPPVEVAKLLAKLELMKDIVMLLLMPAITAPVAAVDTGLKHRLPTNVESETAEVSFELVIATTPPVMAWLAENVDVLMFIVAKARSKLNTPPVATAWFCVKTDPEIWTIDERVVLDGWMAATPPTLSARLALNSEVWMLSDVASELNSTPPALAAVFEVKVEPVAAMVAELPAAPEM
jgi:hypothetical protein